MATKTKPMMSFTLVDSDGVIVPGIHSPKMMTQRQASQDSSGLWSQGHKWVWIDSRRVENGRTVRDINLNPI